MPIGDSVPSGVVTSTESPTTTPSLRARSLPSRMRVGLAVWQPASVVETARVRIAPPMSVTLGSSAGSMPLSVMNAALAGCGDQRLAENRRRGAQRRPAPGASFAASALVVGDAAALPDEDVRVRAEDAIAQLLLQPGHQRQRDDERHDADRHAERRDERDDGDERLLALGEQVAQRDVQLEGDVHASRLRISGNRITSRIDGLLVSSITSRSMPTPSPAVGGRPYSSARM